MIPQSPLRNHGSLHPLPGCALPCERHVTREPPRHLGATATCSFYRGKPAFSGLICKSRLPFSNFLSVGEGPLGQDQTQPGEASCPSQRWRHGGPGGGSGLGDQWKCSVSSRLALRASSSNSWRLNECAVALLPFHTQSLSFHQHSNTLDAGAGDEH